ncbi:effector binding domain-containing protein [Lysinibacillus piscis]|uniref:Transcription activator, effector binding domain-containing protein n=1 Tax=Lysinibacillus piscis TaxID=2518931 RepID=A0ABQ5NNE9_9BACI|nr:effector binding domain-containing protein [Lysinibacillus sp. KH24]GLC89906.1 transcription activator, effector binding domain-containing protein [Lysinibacillus sp. KH24]
MIQQYCQSCGMPLTEVALFGTEKTGETSEDYCFNCYEAGEFKQPFITMEEMLEICIPHLQQDGMGEQEARTMLMSFLPNLKRWHQAPKMVEKEAFYVAGITARTSNVDEQSAEGKIPALWTAFYEQGIGQKLQNTVNPTIYGLYSDYESDVNGLYDITLGLEVPASLEVPQDMVMKLVPASKYMVFTSERGAIHDVVIKTWQVIWAWFEHSTIARAYTGDFELYDERCSNPQDAQVAIYIAIK